MELLFVVEIFNVDCNFYYRSMYCNSIVSKWLYDISEEVAVTCLCA